jgi:hypothetical protein
MNKYGKVLPEPVLEKDSLLQLEMIEDIIVFDKYLNSWATTVQNPYLNRYFKKEPDLSMVMFEQVNKGQTSGWMPNLGSGNMTNIADGLSKFIVNRTKTELNAAFLESLSEQIKKNIYLKSLFPNTRNLLNLMQKRVYNFNPFLQEIRDAANEDMFRLPENMAILLDSNIDLPIPKNQRIWLTDPLFVIDMMVKKGFKSDEIFEKFRSLSSLENPSPAQKGIAEGLKMLYIGSKCISDDKGNRLEKIDTLYRDIFLGIVYEEYKNQSLGEKNLGMVMPTIPDDTLFQLFTRFRDVYNDLDQHFNKTLENSFGIKARYIPYQRMNQDGTITEVPYEELPRRMNSHEILSMVESMNHTMQFAETFMKVLKPTDNTTHRNLRTAAQASDFFTRIVWKANEKRWGEVFLYTSSLVALIAGDNKLTCKFMRYGSFLTSLPACNNSDEVSALIETFALPPGSARIKKQSPFTVGIGSYVGGFGGLEFLRNVNAKDRTATSLSLSAPVGLAISKGYKGWAFTGFASMIDVGAFTAYRFDDANYTAELPAMTFANIFAPGAAFVVGIPKYPFAFGLNAQVGPNIRSITENGVYQFNETGAWRFGVTLTVDIPLMNFYSAGGGDRCF